MGPRGWQSPVMAMLLWLIPATIASRSINICSEIQPKSSDKVPCQSSIHPSSLMENLCAIPLLFFVMQPSRKYNLQCLYDLYCIRSSTLPTIIYLRNNMEMLMGLCLSTSMNEYPDVTHLSCINCCIQGHSVHKQNPIYWNNCLHNQVQCPSL